MRKKVFISWLVTLTVFFIVSLFFKEFSLAATAPPCSSQYGGGSQRCCLKEDSNFPCDDLDLNRGDCTCNGSYTCYHDQTYNMPMCSATTSCGALGEMCCLTGDECDVMSTPGLTCLEAVAGSGDPRCHDCGTNGNYCCTEGNRSSCVTGLTCDNEHGLRSKCCPDSDGDGNCDTTVVCGNVSDPCCLNDNGVILPCTSYDCPDSNNDGICDTNDCYCNGYNLDCHAGGTPSGTMCVDQLVCGHIGQACCVTAPSCLEGMCDTSRNICCTDADNNNACDTLGNTPPLSAVYRGPIIDRIEKIINPAVKMLYYGGLAIGVFFVILAGYSLMTSEGDPQRTKAAQEQLTAAIIGIIFILLSVTILRVIINEIIQM